jgi:hypothetical protein
VEQASTICARPDVLKKRTVKKLLQEIAALERALLERAKRDGQTIEQIMAEVLIRRNAAEHAINAVKELSGLVSVSRSFLLLLLLPSVLTIIAGLTIRLRISYLSMG